MTAYSFERPELTRVVKALLSIQVVLFLCQLISKKFFHVSLEPIMGLVPQIFFQHYYFWQIFTFPFFHADLSHILLNALSLWLFGSTLEHRLGSLHFLFFFFISNLGAGLIHILVQTLFNSSYYLIPLLGSSASNYAFLMAFALFYGEQVMFPIPIKAKNFVLILGAIEVVGAIFYSQDGISHLAHLGGMLVGFLYIYFYSLKYLPYNNIRLLKEVSDLFQIRKKPNKNKHLRIVKDEDSLEKGPKRWHVFFYCILSTYML